MGDRSWICKKRSSVEYVTGVKEFLEFAIANSIVINGKIKCPCQKCSNNLYQTLSDVVDHMICNGICPSYTIWYHHGESSSSNTINNNNESLEPDAKEIDKLSDDTLRTSTSKDGLVYKRHRKRRRTPILEDGNLPQDKRFKVATNKHGQPIGDNAIQVSRYIGALARDGNLLPIDLFWKQVPKSNKKELCSRVKEKFTLSVFSEKWVLQCGMDAWRRWKCRLKKIYFHGEELSDDENEEDMCCTIVKEQLDNIMKYWNSDEAKRQSETNKVNRAKQLIPNNTGTKSLARRREEVIEKSADGKEPSRAMMFIFNHKNNPKFEMEKLLSELPEGLKHDISQDDVYSKVMGPEGHGRVRTYGTGLSPKDIFGPYSSRAEYAQEAVDAQKRVADIEKKYNGLEERCNHMEEENAFLKEKTTLLESTVGQLMEEVESLKTTLSTISQALRILRSDHGLSNVRSVSSGEPLVWRWTSGITFFSTSLLAFLSCSSWI
ncbi:uncharacterized protein LOC116256916 isoform X2 [Nymphaea colorata]|uniref:uncharacterized protein LOC116256916 isoform X2 n=1 Tax=Nymphaea colorata TaxID=210225 RepID=UPI00129D5440|nr:uncharacterized protein LOC116256916 isoform X2 [Nymphaea colorata]